MSKIGVGKALFGWGKATGKGKKSAVDILDKSKKQLQEVMDRGGYSLKDAHTKEFLKEQRKKTVKKILKINKPK